MVGTSVHCSARSEITITEGLQRWPPISPWNEAMCTRCIRHSCPQPQHWWEDDSNWKKDGDESRKTHWETLSRCLCLRLAGAPARFCHSFVLFLSLFCHPFVLFLSLSFLSFICLEISDLINCNRIVHSWQMIYCGRKFDRLFISLSWILHLLN